MKRFERSNGLDTALYKNYLFTYKVCGHVLRRQRGMENVMMRWECVIREGDEDNEQGG